MPYEIRNVDNGFKVCKKRSKRCYSNKPLPRSRAERQLKALYASEADMEGGGFFQNLLKKAFIGVSDMIVRPSGFKQSQVRYGWLRRPIDMPPLEDLAEMVASTYKSDTNEHSADYKLVLKTPTIAVYRVVKKPNMFIIALRGTAFTDINDISADLGIVRTIVEDANTARNVRNSRRYMDDVVAIRDFQNLVDKYLRVKNPVYYGVGHSLSGAMMDELLEDGLVSSAVSFNPAIERRMFAVPNDNHRIYVECDVLYNLLGKFITNGNLEVIPMANPKGVDAGAIETTKGSIECHNINTVIPLMSGKGIENNIDSMYKPKMIGLSFQDLVNRNSSYGEDRFKPISSKPECEAIRNRPITMEYNPTEYNGRTYNNPMAAKQAEAYDKCMRGEKDKPARPPRSDIALKGSGLLDTIVGHIGQNLASEASKGNIFGRIKDTIDEGARRRKEQQDREWSSGLLGRVGIPNPMKLFGGGRPYTFEEWEGKLCKGDDSLLAKKKRAIEERAAKKKPKSAAAAPKKVKLKIVRKVRDEPEPEEEEEMPDWFRNQLTERVFEPNEKWSAEKSNRLKRGVENQQKSIQMARDNEQPQEVIRQLSMLLEKAKRDVEGYDKLKPAEQAPPAAPVRYANAAEARDALRRSMMKSSSSQKGLLTQLAKAMRR